MPEPAFRVGVDLGTTHSVLAYTPILEPSDNRPALPQIFPIPQLVAAGEVRALPLLPSFVYLPGPHDLPRGATALPWGDPGYAVGAFARDQGARVSGRLVASAKSWLCNPAVERTGSLLPWGAPPEVERISAVDASARILAHLRSAWNHAHPGAPLEDQDLVLTVPASFDEVARELTVRAAQQAGLPRFVLLEEPQAAFYDWLSFAGAGQGTDASSLDEALGPTRTVLVVDVGGGTTDLTLIDCGERGARSLTRRAVGEHLMLGGDNMDLALAHSLEPRLGTARLDAGQWSMLVQAARAAKEQLLGTAPPESVKVTVVGRGSRLIGGALSADVHRAEVETQLLDGFLPRATTDAELLRQPRSAIQELGLPFAADPGITRQVLAFLRRHAGEVSATAAAPTPPALPRPDAILLNGGVFNAPSIRSRLLEVVSGWWPGAPSVPLLREPPGRTASLDLSVARGAAWFAGVRRGEGTRIGGGSARSYFVTVDSSTGDPVGLCVVARGQEEGLDVPLPERLFSLSLGTPVRFTLSSSTTEQARVGARVSLESAEALPPIETVLTGNGFTGNGGKTQVRLLSRLTEIGTLELFCEEERPHPTPGSPGLHWKLEFSLRGSAARDALPSRVEPLPPRFDEGRDQVDRVYGKRPLPVSPRDVKDLFRNLEKTLGPRETWSSATCRELWAVLHAGTSRRRRSADHERIWCQLSGYTLRPGFGHPLDAWRVAETWRSFPGGLQFHTEKANWNEWWILWRRVAAGLDSAAHQSLWSAVIPHLQPADPAAKPVRAKGIKPEGADEMLRLAASLERVSQAQKGQLAGILLHRLRGGPGGSLSAWCLGRLGARQPIAGAHTAVDVELVSDWLRDLLALDWRSAEGLPFAAFQMAQATGDRSRDLSPELAEAVTRRLTEVRAPEAWIAGIREPTRLGGAEQSRVFGETLPSGLQLID